MLKNGLRANKTYKLWIDTTKSNPPICPSELNVSLLSKNSNEYPLIFVAEQFSENIIEVNIVSNLDGQHMMNLFYNNCLLPSNLTLISSEEDIVRLLHYGKKFL